MTHSERSADGFDKVAENKVANKIVEEASRHAERILSEAAKDKAAIRWELESAQAARAEAEESRSASQQELEAAQSARAEAEQASAAARQELEAAQTARVEAEETRSASQQELEAAEAARAEAYEAKATAQQELEAAQQKLEAAQQELEAAQTARAEAELAKGAAQQELEVAQTAKTEAKEASIAAYQELEAAEATRAEACEAKATAQQELMRIQERETQLEAEYRALLQEVPTAGKPSGFLSFLFKTPRSKIRKVMADTAEMAAAAQQELQTAQTARVEAEEAGSIAQQELETTETTRAEVDKSQKQAEEAERILSEELIPKFQELLAPADKVDGQLYEGSLQLHLASPVDWHLLGLLTRDLSNTPGITYKGVLGTPKEGNVMLVDVETALPFLQVLAQMPWVTKVWTQERKPGVQTIHLALGKKAASQDS